MVSSRKDHALFSLSSGILLRLQLAGKEDWGFQMVACTGSKVHLEKLAVLTGPQRDVKSRKFKSEAALYGKDAGDDLIRFLSMEGEEVDTVKENIKRSLEVEPQRRGVV